LPKKKPTRPGTREKSGGKSNQRGQGSGSVLDNSENNGPTIKKGEARKKKKERAKRARTSDDPIQASQKERERGQRGGEKRGCAREMRSQKKLDKERPDFNDYGKGVGKRKVRKRGVQAGATMMGRRRGVKGELKEDTAHTGAKEEQGEREISRKNCAEAASRRRRWDVTTLTSSKRLES